MTSMLFYSLSFLSVIIAFGAIYITMVAAFPIQWTYYHYHFRKPINWLLFTGLLIWTISISLQTDTFPFWTIIPLIICALGLFLTYKIHQEVFFKAVNFPKMTTNLTTLPIKEDMELAVIEYDGKTKCYPLDYLIHHHILNDSFNTKLVSLTYCAMCRSIIPFDVTEKGPLFVGSFKGGNMIVADVKTKTFFQQSTFQSIRGKLHPSELQMIPFQILTWKEVKTALQNPEVAIVTSDDLKKFELPVPGIWDKLINSEKTPGVSNKDKSFPSRTRVIGVRSTPPGEEVVYLKSEVLAQKTVRNEQHNFILIRVENTVVGFTTNLSLVYERQRLIDNSSKTEWTINGTHIKGPVNENLSLLSMSDEYWFSWKKFHPKSILIRLGGKKPAHVNPT